MVNFFGNSIYGEIKFIFCNKFVLLFSTFWLFIIISPEVGFIKPSNIPMVVDLPHPLGPKRPIVEPLLILKFIPLTARVFLYFLLKLLILIVTSFIYSKPF